MTISVVIPTYRRPEELARCLCALGRQQRAADQIIIVVRDRDEQTEALLRKVAPSAPVVTTVRVSESGVIAALSAGAAAATGDIIALTDDDALPWPDWLARIEQNMKGNVRVAGIGGRDWVYRDGELDRGCAPRCGEIKWWGRVIAGHHHAMAGHSREVAVLKGVNCAYRGALLKSIGFDRRLAGNGAQVHWELSLGLALRRKGWKLLFDPSLGVDHFPAVRFDEDLRDCFDRLALRNAVANETLILAEHFAALRRCVFVAWALLVGTRGAPGMLQVPRLLLRREARVVDRWLATLQGRLTGLKVSIYGGTL